MAYLNANPAEHPLDGLLTLPELSLPLALWQRIRESLTLAKQRQDHRNLSSQILRDIGVHSTQAHIEANRMAWDVPKGWRC